MSDLTPEGLRARAEAFMYAEFYPEDPTCSEAMTNALTVAFTALVAEARENGCPREHAGLETAMMKVMGGQKALPDGSLGQDVAALCFGYERMLQREVAEARTAVLQEVNQLACSGLSFNLSLEAMLAMHDRVVADEAQREADARLCESVATENVRAANKR